MNRHHILHVLGSAQPEATGIPRLVEGIARSMDPSRFKFHAWFLGGSGPLALELERLGVLVNVIDWRHGACDPGGIWRFATELRKRKFAIVHQHYGGRALRCIVRLCQESRILVHLHGPIPHKYVTHRSAYRIQAADYAIAISRAMAQGISDIPLEVVYPGVPATGSPPSRFSGPSRSSQVVGTAARLVREKGIIYLIRAISLMKSQFSCVQLEIAGSGPELAGLEKEVRTLCLEDRVHFLGWESDISKAYDRWDVFVLPSIEEPFGLVLVEAMAAGLPVVATNVGGIPEVVENGMTGWLVPPADPVALAGRLAILLADSSGRRRMGTAGWLRAREKFSQELAVSAMEKIYEKLLIDRPACGYNSLL